MPTRLTSYTKGWVYNADTPLQVTQCPTCGITYAAPEVLFERAVKNPHLWWYCPNGHNLHFPGDTREKKLERQLSTANATNTHLRDQLEAERRSKAAVKGHLTRALKRGKAGVCPVPGCKRHFENLQRHVASKHPEFAK